MEEFQKISSIASDRIRILLLIYPQILNLGMAFKFTRFSSGGLIFRVVCSRYETPFNFLVFVYSTKLPKLSTQLALQLCLSSLQLILKIQFGNYVK